MVEKRGDNCLRFPTRVPFFSFIGKMCNQLEKKKKSSPKSRRLFAKSFSSFFSSFLLFNFIVPWILIYFWSVVTEAKNRTFLAKISFCTFRRQNEKKRQELRIVVLKTSFYQKAFRFWAERRRTWFWLYRYSLFRFSGFISWTLKPFHTWKAVKDNKLEKSSSDEILTELFLRFPPVLAQAFNKKSVTKQENRYFPPFFNKKGNCTAFTWSRFH